MMSLSESKEIIKQLQFLSLCVDRKCRKLSKSTSNAVSLNEQLLKLCDSIKKNCNEFEKILRGGVPDLIVNLNLLDIIGPQRCQYLKDHEVEKFKKDLERFSKNYLTDSSDPVLGNLYQLFYSDANTSGADSSIHPNVTSSPNVDSAVREIFGSDIEDLNSSSERQLSLERTDASKEADTSTEKVHIISQVSLPNLIDTSIPSLDESEVTEEAANIGEGANESVPSQMSKDLALLEKNLSNSKEGLSAVTPSHDIEPTNSEIKDAANCSDLAENESEKTSSDQICQPEVTELPSSSQGELEKCTTSLGSPKSAKEDLEKAGDCRDVALLPYTDSNFNDVSDMSEKHENSQAESGKTSSELLEENKEQVDQGDIAQKDIIHENSIDIKSDGDSPVDSTTKQQNEENLEVEEKIINDDSLDHLEIDLNNEEQHDDQHDEADKKIEEKASQCATVESASDSLESECRNKETNNADGECCKESGGPSSQVSTVNTEISNPVNTNADENDRDKNKFFANLGLSKTPNYDKIRTIRDELMEIFAEVNCQEDSYGVMREVAESRDTSSDSSDDEDKYSDAKVAAALRELEEDSDTDIEMPSETDLDISTFDIDSFVSDIEDIVESNPRDKPKCSDDNFVQKKCSVILERRDLEMIQKEISSQKSTDSMENDTAKSKSQECEFKECSVLLEPLRTDEKNPDDDVVRKPVDEDAEINRLCQLSTLENKRKPVDEKSVRRGIKRRRRKLELSGSETSDLSGYTTVSEDDLQKERLLKVEEDYDDNIPIDPNTLLAEIVCHTIHDSDSDSSSTLSSDDEGRKPRRKNIDCGKKKEEETRKEKEASWKDDPLLRGSLNLPSEREKKIGETSRKRLHNSDGEEECNKKKKIRTSILSKYLDPNYSDSSTYDSSDDFEDTPKIGTNKKKPTNEDSDIEYIGSTSSNIINIDSDEEVEKKNCRRNILSVLSSKSLTESTQKAAEEEEARVMRLEEQRHMRSSQETMGSEEGIVLDVSKDGSKIVVDPNLSKRLFAHQIDGIKFMWDACYLSVDSLATFQGTGCILAHNMGLGKTLQVVSLVHTLFNHPVTKTKHVLVVCPLSTVSSWKKEFLNALKMVQCRRDIKIFTIESKDDSRTKSLMVVRWRNMSGVLIMGYEAFCRLTKHDNSPFVKEALVDPGPDLVVCDEGHLLKNGKALRTRALMEIRTKRRIALTGTPLQNNLDEYYHMVQFVKPNLLGTKKEFSRQFINPIMNGQYEDSLEQDITLMKKRTHVLHRLLKNTVQRYEATELQKYLENMKDYALFIQLHPVQEKLYRSYLERARGWRNDNMKKAIKSFFVDYQILKYICSHPQLLHTMEAQNIQGKKGAAIREHELISEEPKEVHEIEGLPLDWWKSECSDEIKTNIEFGTKLQVMMAIIEEAEKKGEKVLIFTSSLVELSSVEFFLKLRGTASCSTWKSKVDYFRMDGTVPPSVRTTMCDLFNDESNRTLRVFLMSHKVGGLGLNLVAANRVILLGAGFNPSLDTQSIYRAYRFGQKKNVCIYRLLSMGTMEEKMYHRCVTKLAVACRVVDKHQIARHYKNLDLEGLYRVDIDLSLQRATPAKPDDDILSTILLKFDCIYKYHHHQKLLENRPDEELNEEDQKKAWEEFEQMNEKERNPPAPPAPPSIPNIANIVQNVWNQINMSQPPASMAPADPARSIGQTLPGPNTTSANPPPKTVARRLSMNGAQEQPSQSSPLNLSLGGAKNRPTTVSGQPVPNAMPPRLIPIDKKKMNGLVDHLRKVNVNQKRKTITGVENIGNVNGANAQNGKPKATAIGPNPFVLAKMNHRREDVARSNAAKPNWRTSSSDDFQKSGSNLQPNWGKRAVDTAVRTKGNKEVVVIDISEDTNDQEAYSDTIERQIEALRGRNLTVTKKATIRRDPTPAVIDIT